jgi:hypothetical protein
MTDTRSIFLLGYFAQKESSSSINGGVDGIALSRLMVLTQSLTGGYV